MADHPSLIDESIEQLEKLSSFLAGDIPSNSRSLASLPVRVQLSKETLLTISVLLPKLRVMRMREAAQSSGAGCADCED